MDPTEFTVVLSYGKTSTTFPPWIIIVMTLLELPMEHSILGTFGKYLFVKVKANRIYGSAIIWENKYYFSTMDHYCDDFAGATYGALNVRDIWEIFVR